MVIGNRRHVGFTMVELILVIAIIIIVVGMIFVALDPVERLAAARNARRASDAHSIAEAMWLKTNDTAQRLTEIPNYWAMVGTSGTGCNIRCGNQTGSSIGYALQTRAHQDSHAQLSDSSVGDYGRQDKFSYSAWVKMDEPSANSILGKVYIADTNEIPFGGFGLGSLLQALGQILSMRGYSWGFVVDDQTQQIYPTFALFRYSTGNFGQDYYTAGVPMPIHEFHHMVVTYDGLLSAENRITMYMDGEQIPIEQNGVGGEGGSLRHDTPLSIGSTYVSANPVLNGLGLPGVIDDLRLYNGVLAAADVQAMYYEGKVDGMNAPLVARWEFDEGSGSVTRATNGDSRFDATVSSGASFAHDEATLGDACVEIGGGLDEYIGSFPVGPEGYKYVPTQEKTFYAVSRGAKDMSARACIVENDGKLTANDVIESRK